MNALLDEVRALIDRQERVACILFAEHQPQLDRLAQSMSSSIQQTRAILDSTCDRKLLSKIRAGYVQGWRELPALLESIRGHDAERLISQISLLELG